MTAEDIQEALQKHANAEDAVFLQRFFKTDKGQYGADDVFIGVRVPMTRAVCKVFKDLPLAEIQRLLDSDIHEHRLAAVILLSNQYTKANQGMRQKIFELYLKNVQRGRVNNWDLVDASAEFIIGKHLVDQPRDLLFTLAHSDGLWQRRVAMLSTFHFLKIGNPQPTIDIAEVLLHDPHDLIQKAVGWMLREMGKRVDERLLIAFLKKYAHEMPRTMLRYAIERLAVEQKNRFMKQK
jgi:3-methyladenine DNA glycosylase AlkD